MKKTAPVLTPTFSTILREEIERLKREEIYKNDADIARSADIDASTFSLLKTGSDRVSKVRKYRLQLAAVMGKDFDEILGLAHRFVAASPTLIIDPGQLKDDIKTLAIRFLQNEINNVEIGVPLFFDTAPFYVAERHNFFANAGLNVKLDYVKWAKTLEYLNPTSEDPDNMPTAEQTADVEKAQISPNSEMRLVIYNRESILGENRQQTTVFCFPLAVYFPKNFVLWGRKGRSNDSRSPVEWKEKLKAIYAHKKSKLRIIISGEDMKQGVKEAFNQAGVTPDDNWFVILDQFDGAEAFLSDLGDLWVGGVPQNAIARSDNSEIIVDGEMIKLSYQYNGIVCRKKDLENSASSRKTVLQILWAWYRALKKINTSLESEADFITTKMNIYAGKSKYQASDFIKFWQERSEKFILPESPQEMIAQISAANDYNFRLYDGTTNFADSLKEIEKIIETNGNSD